jgi:hypothetical protein
MVLWCWFVWSGLLLPAVYCVVLAVDKNVLSAKSNKLYTASTEPRDTPELNNEATSQPETFPSCRTQPLTRRPNIWLRAVNGTAGGSSQGA